MFGHIDGTAVGEIFEDGRHLRISVIHAPTMADIWGAQEGAYSIVLSGAMKMTSMNWITSYTRGKAAKIHPVASKLRISNSQRESWVFG